MLFSYWSLSSTFIHSRFLDCLDGTTLTKADCRMPRFWAMLNWPQIYESQLAHQLTLTLNQIQKRQEAEQPRSPPLPSYNLSHVGQRKPLVLRPLWSFFETLNKNKHQNPLLSLGRVKRLSFLTKLKAAAGVEAWICILAHKIKPRAKSYLSTLTVPLPHPPQTSWRTTVFLEVVICSVCLNLARRKISGTWVLSESACSAQHLDRRHVLSLWFILSCGLL